jgi:hypothetical protein
MCTYPALEQGVNGTGGGGKFVEHFTTGEEGGEGGQEGEGGRRRGKEGGREGSGEKSTFISKRRITSYTCTPIEYPSLYGRRIGSC